MNVRERAKNYEAFMSKSLSLERERKSYQEEGIETSGSGTGDKKKMAEEGKTKPVPPPRKKKPLEKPGRSPQLQHRSTFTMQIKSPPAVYPKPSKPLPSSDTEKPKSSRKLPIRPAPHQTPSSLSLESQVPQPRAVPKRPSPVTRPTPAVSFPGSPKAATKEIPKRPPPPSKSSSLPRKPRPPLPPKPTRPVKPVLGAGKEKSATLPKAGSLKPENKTEDNKDNEETREERSRSSTGPHRISLFIDKEVENTEKTVGEDTKDINTEEKGSLKLNTEKTQENFIQQTEETVKELFEEEEVRQEIRLVDSSLPKELSENGEILNGVSQEDKSYKTPDEDVLKDNKESETILKEEEIFEDPNEKMDIDTNFIMGSKESYSEICPEDEDVSMDEQSERLEDAQQQEAKKPQFTSLENMENMSADELCEETPFVGDLSLEVEEKETTLEVSEEKTIGTTEEAEVIANGRSEGDNIEDSQSISNGDSKNPIESADIPEESIPIDMASEDSNEKSVGKSNEIEISSPSFFANGNINVCEDEEISSVDKSLEREEEQQIFESAVDDEVKSLKSEETAVDKRKSSDQDEPDVNTVIEEQRNVEQKEETQHPEMDDVLESTPKESDQLVDEEKYDQDDSVTEVEIFEEEKKEEALDMGKDATTNDEQDENLMVKAGEAIEMEDLEEALENATQQHESQLEDFNEASRGQPCDVTIEDDLLLQEEVTEAAAEEKLSEKTNETQSSVEKMEEVTTDPHHLGELSSEHDVPLEKHSESLDVTIDNAREKDNEMCVEDQVQMVLNVDESVYETMESTSLKTKKADQENDPFSLDEPIRPRRPSRLKKLAKNNVKETETTSASKPLVRSQIELSCQEEEPQSKPVALYENVILDVSNKIGLPEPLQDSSQSVPEKPSPRYENVILPSEGKGQENGSPSIYEVPRRSSFHADRSQVKMVRKSRSSSIGSFERKSESEYEVPKPRSRTVAAEQTYVVPRPTRLSSENDETYVVPIRTTSPTQASPVFESEYHVPQSLVIGEPTEAEYQVPPRVRSTTGSEEEEGVYSLPTSPPTIPRGPRTAHPSGSEEEEGMYSVPTSNVSLSGEMQVEGEGVRQSSECDDNAVYSVPSASVAKDSEQSLDETLPEGELRRSSRSSVLTSRKQLPTSFRHAPQKPPRSSILIGDSKDEDQETKTNQEDEGYKPVPVPTPRSTVPTPRSTVPTTKQSPKVTPRMKPQPTLLDEQADDTKKEEKLPAPSLSEDQSKSSPKPKRPAPPRPKAPGVSPLPKKEVEETVTPEVKYSAPPRPPPPSVNRTSFAPSEPESVPSATGLQSQSSESESEDEKAPEPTGPPKKKTYFVAHEILSTEKTFVNALTLCYEDCYGLIRSADVVPESVLNDIFRDLGNIYQLDVKFLQELEERMKTWDDHERIGDIVKKYGHFLKMYTTYINNYDKAMNVLQETTKENPQFAELVNQFQASKKCNGLFLTSFMLKPVQRIPSYRLLLKDYLKHLPPDSDEFEDIQVALGIVSEVATHINESMKKADNFERVLRIQESLVGNAEIVKPGRDLIKEGVLKKLCRKDMQERMFFLLTDVLLYTAPVGSTQYKLKEKLPLMGIKVTLPESPDFENEFSIISKMRSFTLSASTPAERDEWIEELKTAINALADKKKTFLKPKDGSPVVETEVEEESKIGEKAPVWIPDARVTMCMLCTDNFTVTNRRHHCRGCGKVVCGSCSDNLAPLAYLDYVQARVCEVCYDFLLKEQNKIESNNDFERLPASPLGMTNEDLDRIHRKPPKFEILHRFKPGSRSHAKRKSKAFGRPSVCTEVVGHDSGSQMSGYLKFKRTNRHGWKRLWFVLKDNVLYTYKASEDVVAIETIPILGYIVQEATRTEDEIQFQLKHAGLPPITFKTESESSVSRWIQELKKATTL